MNYDGIELPELKALFEKANKAYHDDDAPIMDDASYDELAKVLRAKLEETGETFDVVGSLGTKGFAPLKHRNRKMSLENALSLESAIAFVRNCQAHGAKLLSEEPKIDGLSLTLTYIDGRLAFGATRGDGEVGENVTANLAYIDDIPKVLPSSAQGIIEVSGEAYMTHADFTRMNEELSTRGEKVKANPRNAASGTLRQHNSEILRERKLRFFAYDAIFPGEESLDYLTRMEKVRSLGFITTSIQALDISKNDIEDAMLDLFRRHEAQRPLLEYDIDGIVLKVAEADVRQEMGEATRTPNWAIAWKFPPSQGKTILKRVEFQVGRSGQVTPVAVLTPLNIGGVMVERATLHSVDFFAAMDPHVGSVVTIQRAGDVIPQVVSMEPQGGDRITFPKTCPHCNSKLIFEGAIARCSDENKNCAPQVIGMIEYVFSRDVFNAKGLGSENIRKLYYEGVATRPDHLFSLRDDADKLKAFREIYPGRAGDIILAAIETARKNVPVWKIIAALCIPGVGVSSAKEMARYMDTVDYLVTALDSEETDWGMGDVKNASIHNWWVDLKNREYLFTLVAQLDISENAVTGASPWFMKKMVFTGSAGGYDRKKLEAIAERLGAKISSSVSKNTDIVVYGDGAGKKLADAQKHGVQTIKIEEWIAAVNASEQS